MRYDEITGDIVDDDDASTPYRSEYSSYVSRRRSFDWREKLSRIFNYIVFAAACFFIGGFIGKYRPQDKIEEWWRSFSTNHISREGSGINEDTTRPQEARYTVICWSCNAELDATHLRHLSSFNGVCPLCNAQLHVEQHR